MFDFPLKYFQITSFIRDSSSLPINLPWGYFKGAIQFDSYASYNYDNTIWHLGIDFSSFSDYEKDIQNSFGGDIHESSSVYSVCYSKISSDKKTISWFADGYYGFNRAAYQFNMKDSKYTYLAIG